MASTTLLGSLLFLASLCLVSANSFVFEGFDNNSKLNLEGSSIIKSSNLLKLTNKSTNIIGHAFYETPFQMLNNTNSSHHAYSFSTSFVFSIVSPTSGSGGFGLAFTIAPSTEFPGAEAGHFLGLLNSNNNGLSSNHLFAVEFDTVNGFKADSDSEGNHVGVNLNGMNSTFSEPAAYIEEGTENVKEDFRMAKVDAVQAWIEYDGEKKTLNVTVAPLPLLKPSKPLISEFSIDLESVMKENMYVGFSASTGAQESSSHYILGWSFAVNEAAPSLNISKLPKPPEKEKEAKSFPWVKVVIGILSAFTFSLLCLLFVQTVYKRYKMEFEALEDWEMDCPHRFRYKDLHIATKGFKESELIGVGGFGAVYKGVMPNTGTQVAVKRILSSPFQGLREFAAEIESLGRLRHKNLVNLQGWCKKKNDLLLVYDFISNGSLDSILFNSNANSIVLNWDQRFNILKGITAGLLYLHEEWEQVVIHRDVKTSNILIDNDLNARLGDFGLARLYDHGQVSHTTNVVGTLGYIAPELTRTAKSSTKSDVYAYGVLLLEVVTGKRPVDSTNFFLVDWVIENFQLGQILEVVDSKLDSVYDVEEVELVLKLGLLCTQHKADYRPSMRQVARYLNFDDPLPDIADWRSGSESSNSRLSLGFLEGTSMSSATFATSSNSIGMMSTMSIDGGR